MQALIKQSENTLHAVARILCDSDFVCYMNMTVLLSSPLKEREEECPDKEPDKNAESDVDAEPQLVDRVSAPSPPVPV